MKLLDTGLGNTKIKKTQDYENPFGQPFRLASLSLWPDDIICAGSLLADCREGCLRLAGRGRMPNVMAGRQAKTKLFHNDPELFLSMFENELENFQKVCDRDGLLAVVRPNTISDISWEKYDLPQKFPEMVWYDYTKIAYRLGRTPENYKLMFSYSGVERYQNQVKKALKTEVPISVVFNGPFPKTFMGRDVIDGDRSDLVNLYAGPVILGLKAKGPAKQDTTGFVVHTNLATMAA